MQDSELICAINREIEIHGRKNKKGHTEDRARRQKQNPPHHRQVCMQVIAFAIKMRYSRKKIATERQWCLLIQATIVEIDFS